VTKWTIARAQELGEEIDAAEAVGRYQAAWKCSQTPAKQPVRKDPTTGKVCGRNYYLPEMLRSMPRLVKGSRSYLERHDFEIPLPGIMGGFLLRNWSFRRKSGRFLFPPNRSSDLLLAVASE
jgi:hypothetical protein